MRTLALMLVLVLVAPLCAQELLPTEAVTGRLHIMMASDPGGQVRLAVVFVTRGAEPLLAPDGPHGLNPKAAVVMVDGPQLAEFERVFGLLKPADPVSIDTSQIPNWPAGAQMKVVSAATPARVILRPHRVAHGPIAKPHFDFVTFYPPL